MTAPTSAYPLTWPVNRPRAASRHGASFKQTLGSALNELRYEVRLLGATELLVSSDLPLRRDGEPRSDTRMPADPGVAVYFTYKKRPMCFACDKWHCVEDNVHAIALTIGALRGIERWGSGSMMEQAFMGFTALPAPEQPFQVLGIGAHATKADIMEAWQRLASKHHPDKRGGDHDTMARINAARDAMLAAFNP